MQVRIELEDNEPKSLLSYVVDYIEPRNSSSDWYVFIKTKEEIIPLSWEIFHNIAVETVFTEDGCYYTDEISALIICLESEYESVYYMGMLLTGNGLVYGVFRQTIRGSALDYIQLYEKNKEALKEPSKEYLDKVRKLLKFDRQGEAEDDS